MSKMDNIREIIRELIKKEIDEATTTGNIAGYETPMAFTGGKNRGKKKKREIATNSTGYNVVKEGKYHDYRNDDTLTSKQKIGRSMREVRDSLKNELNVDSRSYWKNTHKALNKISERLVKLANKVGQLQ